MERTTLNSKIQRGILNRHTELRGWLSSHKTEFILLLSILLIAAVCRLYKIDSYMTFLGDEGRDAIVMNKIVNLRPVLLGPGTSIGNMYLGPLYYYLTAPAFLLAGNSPVGASVLVAVLGVITVYFVWLVFREWFPSKGGSVNYPALASALFYALSPVVITYSRSSWNPNIMPFFALLSIYAIWRVYKYNQLKWLIVFGMALAFVLNSHYLGLLIFPTVGLFWFATIIRNRKNGIKKYLLMSLAGGVVFLGLMSPLVLFDLRHNFMNFKAIETFFTVRQSTVSIKPWNAIPNLYPLLEKINLRVISAKNVDINTILTWGIVATLLWSIYELYKKKGSRKDLPQFALMVSWIGFGLIGMGLYRQEIYDHYYGFLFPALFIFLGYVFMKMFEVKGALVKIGTLAVFVALLVSNLADNPLRFNPNNQFQRTNDVSKKIIEESKGEPFNFATIAERNYEDGYVFFLQRYNSRLTKIDPQLAKETITQQLFVACEKEKTKCDPTHNDKAEIANFGWSKIEAEWDVSGVVLYKLTHAR